MRIIILVLTILCFTFSLSALPVAETQTPTLDPEQRDALYTQAVQNFSDALFYSDKKIREDNSMISPLSALLALGMTANGADGETQKQMLHVLAGDTLGLADFNAANQAYVTSLKQDNQSPLHIANSLWANELISFERDFLDTVEKKYAALATSLDFSNPQSVSIINNWVSDATNKAINEIIDSIDRNTILYLINAISFKDDWLSVFEKNLTRERPFYTNEGSTLAKFLHKEESFAFLELEDGDLILLPYKHPDYLMVAILPKQGISIDSWLGEKKQSSLSRFIMQSIDKAQYEYISLALPTFESSYKDSLVDNLQRLGMTLCFDASRSDFSNMLRSAGKAVVIDDVLHKTYIRLDEQGTEAAAVTAVVMKLTSMAPRPARSLIFDRPFFYAIIDTARQIPLFMGVLDHPQEI